MKRLLTFFQNCLIVILLLSQACSDDPTSNTPEQYEYTQPITIDDGWETSDLASVGIETEKLEELVDYINFGLMPNIHSILIIRNGKLVFEEYFPGHRYQYNAQEFEGQLVNYDMNTIHNQASVTKSYTSALIGIAIDKGFISSIDEKVFDFFPEYSEYNTGMKQNMTIEHLLSMTSGFEWNESDIGYENTDNDLIQMWMVDDPLRYLISQPLNSNPGTSFYYNSGCTNLLGEIIFKTSGQKPDVFASSNLFGKLGIESYTWEKFNNGVVFVSGDLKITPRAMAKFGYLFLNKGVWKGEQVISADWIVASTNKFINVNGTWDYGYKWWLRKYNSANGTFDSFSARGWGGQVIAVFPDLNMVIVFTGGNYASEEPSDVMISDYILPSIVEIN